jgi:hypothetical protein
MGLGMNRRSFFKRLSLLLAAGLSACKGIVVAPKRQPWTTSDGLFWTTDKNENWTT